MCPDISNSMCLMLSHISSSYQIAPLLLIQLNSFKQSLEITSTKTLGNGHDQQVVMARRTHAMVVTFNDLYKEGWPVLHWFGEYLKEVAIVIKINKNIELL